MKIAVLQCVDCGRLAISVNDVRRPTYNGNGFGHGDGKCSGSWRTVVTTERPSHADLSPRRIQRKRTKGWKMPPNTVYVGRPTKWGNPYGVGNGVGQFVNREGAVSAYRRWIEANQQTAERFRKPIAELRGKNLACWCPFDQPCHADVLLEIANG